MEYREGVFYKTVLSKVKMATFIISSVQERARTDGVRFARVARMAGGIDLATAVRVGARTLVDAATPWGPAKVLGLGPEATIDIELPTEQAVPGRQCPLWEIQMEGVEGVEGVDRGP